MALVMLPGLSALIEHQRGEEAAAMLWKQPFAKLSSRATSATDVLYIGISEDPFDEYFSNFDVGLDLDEEGYRVLASKSSSKRWKARTTKLVWLKFSRSLMTPN